MHSDDVHLLSLSVCEAPYPASQTDAKQFVSEMFRDGDFDLDATAAVYDNAGIKRRTFALPLERYAAGLGVAERNRLYIETAGRMLEQAAAQAVQPDLRNRVTHVVLVSSTGIATPSLDCAVIESLGIHPDAQRIPVFGLGCAGGVAGLQLARDLARSDPDALVLVLCVELTSLTLLVDDQTRRNFVACALFGDGAAAALIGGSSMPGRVRIGAGLCRLFPDTHELMGWDVRNEGWRVIFSPRIPAVVRAEVDGLVRAVADPDTIRHFVLHPGGQKVLDAYREALGLGDSEMACATDVLANHGNMSAVTVLFVLERFLSRADGSPGRAILSAFGPGFTAQVLEMELLGAA
ncbi:MAG: 3-oxoacyl-[acyl-carrier-protein] synthase III C-terminal domain-containing protein [Planctomycetota bacterium]